MVDRRGVITGMAAIAGAYAIAGCTPRRFESTPTPRLPETVDPDRQVIEQEVAKRRIRRSNSEIALWAPANIPGLSGTINQNVIQEIVRRAAISENSKIQDVATIYRTETNNNKLIINPKDDLPPLSPFGITNIIDDNKFKHVLLYNSSKINTEGVYILFDLTNAAATIGILEDRYGHLQPQEQLRVTQEVERNPQQRLLVQAEAYAFTAEAIIDEWGLGVPANRGWTHDAAEYIRRGKSYQNPRWQEYIRDSKS